MRDELWAKHGHTSGPQRANTSLQDASFAATVEPLLHSRVMLLVCVPGADTTLDMATMKGCSLLMSPVPRPHTPSLAPLLALPSGSP